MSDRIPDPGDNYLANKLVKEMSKLGDASNLEYMVFVRAGNWFCCEESMTPESTLKTMRAVLRAKKVPWFARLFILF